MLWFFVVMGLSNTQSAVHRSFAIADNIGEVSAKAQVIIFPCMTAMSFIQNFILFPCEHILTCGVGFRYKRFALITLVSCLLHF